MTYSINLSLVDGCFKNEEKGVCFSTVSSSKGMITTTKAISWIQKVNPGCYAEVIGHYQVYVLIGKDGKSAEMVYHPVSDIGVHVNWMIGWENVPEIDILNGSMVRSDITFKEYAVDNRRTLYVGFDESKVFGIFMLSSPFGLKGGACGGNLHMEDGRTIRVTGAWSSRSSVVNMFLPEQDHVVECHMAGQYLRCAVRVSWLRDHLPKDTYLRKEVDKDGEIKYNIYPIEGSEIYKELMIKKPSLCRSHWVKRA